MTKNIDVLEFTDVNQFLETCFDKADEIGYLTKPNINGFALKEGLVLKINDIFVVGQIDEVFDFDDKIKFLTFNIGGYNREYGVLMDKVKIEKITVYLDPKKHYNLMSNIVFRF